MVVNALLAVCSFTPCNAKDSSNKDSVSIESNKEILALNPQYDKLDSKVKESSLKSPPKVLKSAK